MFNLPYEETGKKILWQEMWRHELEEAATRGPVVIVPTGSIEQHGPHCPMDVDIITSFSMAIETAMKVDDFPVIVAPPIWFGFAHYNMGFAGTISLSMNTYRNLLLDVCRSIHANHFERIIVLNGHGGNRAPNVSIKHELTQEDIFILSLGWEELVQDEMRALATSDGDDQGHGGEWETSLQLYLRPQLIVSERMVVDRGLTNPFSPEVQKFVSGWGAFGERRRDTEKGTGIMGDPTVATAEKGKAIFEAVSTKLAKVAREFHDLPVRKYTEFGSYCP